MKTISYSEINDLTRRCIDNLDLILDYFGIQRIERYNMIRSCCHIHGGDNITAFNLYHTGDIIHYKCRTHHCEEFFGKSFVCMIRGLLSHQRYGWMQPGDKIAGFEETINFLKVLLNIDQLSDNSKVGDIDKIQFNLLVAQLNFNRINGEEDTDLFSCAYNDLTRLDIRRQFNIPSQYFLKRGFSSSVLDEYDVGDCYDVNHEMNFRAVVPIYNENYKYIGCTGRSFYELCKTCKGYHHPQKPCLFTPKWKHSTGLKRRRCLYNLNKAKKQIMAARTAVIVESPGNVWRLEESGIHNSVAIFGTAMQEEQRLLLDSLGAMALIIILDQDIAGQDGTRRLVRKLENLYGVYYPPIPKQDIGEMSVNEVTQHLKPYIEDISGAYV